MRPLTCIWFESDMDRALATYTGLVPESAIVTVSEIPTGVRVARFTLGGLPYMAFQSPPLEKPTHAVSLVLECDTQVEIDRAWAVLVDGGEPERCGWLRDRWGVFWQVVPRRLPDLLRPVGSPRAQRVFEAMLGMVKLDLAALERAAGDREVGGPAGPEPTRYGDWEVKGRASDF